MLGATVLLLGLCAYAVWSAVSTRSDLLAAKSDATSLQRGLAKKDTSGVHQDLRALQQHFGSAHRRTDGPVWALGSHVPWVGDDVRAVRTLAAVGDDLSQGTLAEIVDETDGRLVDKLAPHGGRVDIDAIKALAPVIGRAHRNVNEAAGRLLAADSSSLTHWIRPEYATFANKLEGVNDALAAADRAVQVLPSMVGEDRPRTYLLLFDNNAEVRSTGGLPGAFAVIRADAGEISLVRQGAPADIGEFPAPVLPQSVAEKSIYFGQVAQFPQDTNFTPEFPRTAALLREMWRRTQHQDLDGVLSADAVALSYVLRATGPIEAPGGVTLTSKNATDELMNKVYFRIADGKKQNEFFAEVARRAFDKVAGGVSSAPALISALGQSANEGRVYVHDFDPVVQRALSGSTVAGELQGGDPRVPQVGVYFNDATGSKMSYYLRTKVALKAESCAAGVQQLAGTADLTYTGHSPPVDELNDFVTGPGTYGTPRGEQLVLARIYGPTGGDISDLRVAGQPTPVDPVMDRGRPVVTAAVQLRRGDTVRVSWRVRSGHDQDRDARLAVTPGIVSTPAVRTVPAACDAP